MDFNPLFPLDAFYHRSQQRLPPLEVVSMEEVPEPYRSLLCGAHDMTPTLEAFHKDRIRLEVRDRFLAEDALWRLVVLHLQNDNKRVEFGAIVIPLRHYPTEARNQVLEGQCPLGSILAVHHVNHLSSPQAYLRVLSDPFINAALGVEEERVLYGRRNHLLTQNGEILADILEILPPA
jgi:chorismate-pyruvate lyase